ncbi:hybrid sensor histidine kinase/response regulator [Comamonas piscis]|uniref:histidine kinase n=1 Tax=Comamonas piscis TaxID=1562974 RepID=A0A7G5EK54_9BURK|nr:hybrid sensor histidine kinase/response regulator [Comamonas piscis]QMV74379.1 hybrid sensor histidine kinase/response regulator [Comamonas piscis]WSO32828.1 hybrid sensor histidine kinase/response regulator [Comamonas piscis]
MNTIDGIKCLIVDDIPQNLVALEALLQRDGVQFLKAHSAREALELLLLHNDIALALLDVQMPEMNGFDLAALIRGSERTRNIPLIFMTAGTHEQNWQFQGYESGAVDFLYKPIDPDMLSAKVNIFFELHRRKQDLAQQLQERTEALRVNEMFMAVLSHDLRNPLQSIKMAATLLKRQTDASKNEELAERLLGNSQRMARMVEDLLDVTRIRQAGGLRLSVVDMDLRSLSDAAVDDARQCASDRELDYQVLGDTQGRWDGERLAQVVSNIMGNALKHGAKDAPIRVTLDGSQPGELLLTIQNGGTIPPSLLADLFKPFRGGERQPGQSEGLGLGLYIAQQIARAHGGSIQAQSAEGQTRFDIRLPRQPLAHHRQAVL